MSRAVFVDASAWIAITNRRDDYHFVAQELYRELLAGKTPLFTTTWVAYEALSSKTYPHYPRQNYGRCSGCSSALPYPPAG
ncbi:hypothetical protein hamaS1_03160 [Moorella sp. Hama-1]|nr:hypothetical protein hamaS1_03160 [Moorella sp. Hama-1]